VGIIEHNRQRWNDVRQTSCKLLRVQVASRACFQNLSSYGVKEILPTLLDGLDDTQWRSQKGTPLRIIQAVEQGWENLFDTVRAEILEASP
jgi:hypothetical protein